MTSGSGRLAARAKGGIWVSTFYEGLFQWDGSRFVATVEASRACRRRRPSACCRTAPEGFGPGRLAEPCSVLSDGKWRQYGREHGLPPNPVLRLIEGADGTIWAALGGGGLYSLAKDSSPAVWQKVHFPNDGVVSLLEDQEQNLWVGTRARGLTRLKPKRVSVVPILSGETETVPRTLAETPDGVLWVGTSSRGLFRIQDGKLDAFLRGSSRPRLSLRQRGSRRPRWQRVVGRRARAVPVEGRQAALRLYDRIQILAAGGSHPRACARTGQAGSGSGPRTGNSGCCAPGSSSP